MTQKTLPILGTVCTLSLVLLGVLAGCKKSPEENKDTTSTEASETKKEDQAFENKKDISFEDVKENEVKDVENSEKKDTPKDDTLKTNDAEKEGEKVSHKENKGNRVALVEKTLEMMANTHRGSDVEDVVLA